MAKQTSNKIIINDQGKLARYLFDWIEDNTEFECSEIKLKRKDEKAIFFNEEKK